MRLPLQNHWLCKDRVHIKDREMDFADGPLAKTLPASAGDTGSIPGPRRFPMPPDISAWEPRLLKPVHREPVLRNRRNHCREKPVHRSEE